MGMFDSDRLPILFENETIVVFQNPSDEIFVRTKQEPAVQMRITGYKDYLVATEVNGHGHMRPTSVNGLPGFVVRHP